MITSRRFAACLGLVTAVLFAAPGATEARDEIEELLSFTRSYRLVQAESLRVALVERLDTAYDQVPPHARDRVALLAERRIAAELPIDDLALTGALLHGLAGEIDPADLESRAQLSAAAAAVAQECLHRLRGRPNPWGLSPDSLRALGARTALAPVDSAGTVAPAPPPYDARPDRVLLERGEVRELIPAGADVDWYQWIPGTETLLARAGGELFACDVAGTVAALGDAGAPGSPAPSITPTAEYVAAPNDSGAVRVLRRGVAGGTWSPLDPGFPVTAFAFSPAGLLLAAGGENGEVAVHDLSDGTWRTVTTAPRAIAAVHWSPRGESVAWDERGDDGVVRWAGVSAVIPGGPEPPDAQAASFDLAGPPAWAPDGVSWIAAGRRGGEAGVWRVAADGVARLASIGLGRRASILSAPDFRTLAVVEAPDPHPDPFGWSTDTPFRTRARPWTILEIDWRGPRADAVLDRPVETAPDAVWDYRARWFFRAVEFAGPGLLEEDASKHETGLWALDLLAGDDVPLTHPREFATAPKLSSKQTWLAYLARERAGDTTGRLRIRELQTAEPNPREAERMHLRALPLIKKREVDTALRWLRDSLRMDPQGIDTRRVLAETMLLEAARAPDGAAAGRRLNEAVREMGRLHAFQPGHPVFGRLLAREFVSLSVLSGAVYAQDAARRAQAFLDADPERAASPERVREVLLPALLDVMLWDPFRAESREVVEAGLKAYRQR